ncbi:MAG: Fic family protein [Bacteroidia bacterium]|nr:Fic family protein [Bacteroidia bacterium]
MATALESLITRFKTLGIDQQLDYDKYYLYSIITHSTAIEGSTVTELENQIMFDEGISLKGKSLEEQMMNLDLKVAYEKCIRIAKEKKEISVAFLQEIAALVMKNTGKEYRTALGDFSSANGDLRLLNVTAGAGGKSYMNYNKVPAKLRLFCEKLNKDRREISSFNMQQKYEWTFDAHYNLVTIHPWADGNGRMARLIMNYLQFEQGIIPSKILKEDREEYIKALISTRENEDLTLFRNFMTGIIKKNLNHDIEVFLDSTEIEPVIGMVKTEISREKTIKSREKIISLLAENSSLSASAIAEKLSLSPKAIEKHFSKLKAEGILRRIGPDKGGHWEVIP